MSDHTQSYVNEDAGRKEEVKMSKKIDTIDETLEERGSRYGKFSTHSEITQNLKATMRATANWDKLSASQAEALEMVAHKIGRILNGDPDYDDSWVDIAGYTQLIVKELHGEGV